MSTAAPTPPVRLPEAPGLLFRPMEGRDAPAWLALVRRIAQADGAPWHEQSSDLAEVLDSAVNPAAQNTVAAVDGDGVLRAYGYVSKNLHSTVGRAMGGVDPSLRRRRIGSAILAWQRQVLRGRSEPGGQAAAVVRSYVQEATPGHAQLLQAQGFAAVRTFTELARGLVDVPAPPPVHGVEIVAFAPEHAEAVRLAHNEAFADHWGSEPRTAAKWQSLLAHENFRPDWSSLAVDGTTGEVAGYQISMFDPTVEGASGFRDGYTELVGVRRAWRGRGIAPALLADAMARYAAAGMERACLDVDTENPSGAVALYGRLGYRPLPGRRSVAWELAL